MVSTSFKKCKKTYSAQYDIFPIIALIVFLFSLYRTITNKQKKKETKKQINKRTKKLKTYLHFINPDKTILWCSFVSQLQPTSLAFAMLLNEIFEEIVKLYR